MSRDYTIVDQLDRVQDLLKQINLVTCRCGDVGGKVAGFFRYACRPKASNRAGDTARTTRPSNDT